jgi:hypothetical protein
MKCRSSFLLLLGGFAFMLLLMAVSRAEEDRERTILCAMLSRELVRVEIETGNTYSPVLVSEVLNYEERADASLKEITAQDALKRYTTHLQLCEVMIDISPSLPKVEAATNEAWARSVVSLASRFDGIAPATGRPLGTDAWREACSAEYRTWDPETETVVRKGSPERVRCPCGEEVDCGGG